MFLLLFLLLHILLMFHFFQDALLEMNNLYDNSKYSKKREELTKLLYARMASVGDFCDPTKPDWGYPTKLKWEQIVKVNP